NINSFKVSLIGEINRPGRLELRSWTTVLDALALAGGFTQFASRSKIVILQPDGKGMKRIPFNYNKALDGEQENFYLLNGDIILVPYSHGRRDAQPIPCRYRPGYLEPAEVACDPGVRRAAGGGREPHPLPAEHLSVGGDDDGRASASA